MAFTTIGRGTPVWSIALESFLSGFFKSLQYTCMNTVAYAEVTEGQASSANSLANTMQQMSSSFGVASASLVAAFFLTDRYRFNPLQFINGIHCVFFCTRRNDRSFHYRFLRAKKGDDKAVSQAKGLHAI
jgi:hypothetical protein